MAALVAAVFVVVIVFVQLSRARLAVGKISYDNRRKLPADVAC